MIADAGSVAVTVTDDDATTVTLAGAAGDMTEGGSKTSTVTLGRGLMNGESLAVPLSFSGGATRGTDYTMSGAAATGVTYQNLNSGDATVTFTGPESGGETVVIDLDTLDANSGTGLGGAASGTDNLAEFSINDATTNTAPTGADKTVTTNEDTAYTFAAADFGFAAADAGDTLSSVKITTLESAGDLELDGTGVTVNQAIMKADIDDGDLTFTPAANVNGTGYATFGFKVNDNKVDSTAAYTMTINVTAVNDAPTDVPTITGTVTQGQTLTAVTSAIADPDGLGTFSYQWKRGGTNITGAISSTYTLVQDDVGETITVTVSWTDVGGTAESVTTAETAAVANVNDAPTGAPTITGTATRGQQLTASTSGIVDPDDLGTFSYQWKHGGTNISGTTSATSRWYRPTWARQSP